MPVPACEKPDWYSPRLFRKIGILRTKLNRTVSAFPVPYARLASDPPATDKQLIVVHNAANEFITGMNGADTFRRPRHHHIAIVQGYKRTQFSEDLQGFIHHQVSIPGLNR